MWNDSVCRLDQGKQCDCQILHLACLQPFLWCICVCGDLLLKSWHCCLTEETLDVPIFFHVLSGACHWCFTGNIWDHIANSKSPVTIGTIFVQRRWHTAHWLHWACLASSLVQQEYSPFTLLPSFSWIKVLVLDCFSAYVPSSAYCYSSVLLFTAIVPLKRRKLGCSKGWLHSCWISALAGFMPSNISQYCPQNSKKQYV